jgi:hypothetical protein
MYTVRDLYNLYRSSDLSDLLIRHKKILTDLNIDHKRFLSKTLHSLSSNELKLVTILALDRIRAKQVINKGDIDRKYVCYLDTLAVYHCFNSRLGREYYEYEIPYNYDLMDWRDEWYKLKYIKHNLKSLNSIILPITPKGYSLTYYEYYKGYYDPLDKKSRFYSKRGTRNYVNITEPLYYWTTRGSTHPIKRSFIEPSIYPIVDIPYKEGIKVREVINNHDNNEASGYLKGVDKLVEKFGSRDRVLELIHTNLSDLENKDLIVLLETLPQSQSHALSRGIITSEELKESKLLLSLNF